MLVEYVLCSLNYSGTDVVQAIKLYRFYRGIAPSILKLGTISKSVEILTSRLMYPGASALLAL
jgi:hypothetical protein